VVFDSSTFLAFFAIFLVAHQLAWRSYHRQNLILLAASSIFYGWWDWRFLGLMYGTAGVDYLAGRLLGAELPAARRKLVLGASVSINLAILFVFKYFNFFAESAVFALRALGIRADPPAIRLILPVGVSFYTFQSISYAVDCYRRLIKPERNPISYFTFVCCFPHLVAGPIQRATHLLTQLNRPRIIRAEHAREAVWLLAWGFFLKQAVSNPAAAIVGMAFQDHPSSGWTTILGTLAFAVQIYCDFLGYSLIARGTGRLIGLEFIWNFNQPYFATSIRDFWRRWHISLSTWLRDYLYVALGGNRGGSLATYRNLMLTMLLGGLWHGASWTFVAWGALHGGALCVDRLLSGHLRAPKPAGWAITMLVVLAGWFLFRCQSFAMARSMLSSLADLSWSEQHTTILRSLAAAAAPVVVVELWQWMRQDPLAPLSLNRSAFAVLTGSLVFVTFSMWNRIIYGFIYFQF
jgi:D-alanyl-lipoteichoic acid acyltransferase DltB (MBOAT superfamily)